MKKSYLFYLVLSFLFLAISSAMAVEPTRAGGLSVHVLPDRVANLNGKHGGFTVSDPVTKKMGDTYSEPEELLVYFHQLPETVKQNGIWIVTTNPDSYSEYEHSKIAKLITLSSEEGIPVFTCRAKDLPNGWKRVDAQKEVLGSAT